MRLPFVLMTALVLLVGCQSKKTAEDYYEKPKECSVRDTDSGLCVPGSYDDDS